METRIDGKKTVIGIMITSLLAALGMGTAALTQDQFENAYVCELWGETENTYFFYGGLSGTRFRGYPNKENRKGYKDCKLGDDKLTWITLSDYAENNGINPTDLILNQEEKEEAVLYIGQTKQSIPKSYNCKQSQECVEVN